MAYQLKAGEYVKNGVLYGWTGKTCGKCGGHGTNDENRACFGCGGTGEEHGVMPVQPHDLEDSDGTT